MTDKPASSQDVFDAFLLLTQFCGIKAAMEEIESSEEVSKSASTNGQVSYLAVYSQACLAKDQIGVKFANLVPRSYSDHEGLSTDGIRVILVGFEILKYKFDDCLNMLQDMLTLAGGQVPASQTAIRVAAVIKYLAKNGYVSIISNYSKDDAARLVAEDPDASPIIQIGIELLEKGAELLGKDYSFIEEKLKENQSEPESSYDLMAMTPASSSVN